MVTRNISWPSKIIFAVISMLVLLFTQSSLMGKLFVLLFYIYGSIPFALFFTYVASGEVIHRVGTKNVGVANAFWVGGLAAGLSTVAGEISKALLPLLVSHYYFGGDLMVSLALVFSAAIGTNFSIFLKGKGGLGRTILIWTLLVFAPVSAILLGAMWLVVYRIWKDSYNSSVLNNFLVPVVLLFVERSIPLTVFGLAAATLFFLSYDRSRDDFANFKATTRFKDFFTRERYLVSVSKKRGLDQIGGKADKLGFLQRKGFRIPETYVCPFRVYEKYISGDDSILERLKEEIANLVDSNKSYSVRSSANLEDAESYSFAGQFESYLDLKGSKRIVEAVEKVWRSAESDRVKAYLNKIGKPGERLKMAVIVQEMINPDLSCVVFTKNPISGMDETVLELVYGSGDSLVQDGVTPNRWVYKWGEWIEKPEDPANTLPVVTRMVREANKIAEKFGKPVDLECVYNGKDIYWLQLREVTTLKTANVYSNRISKEFLPGIIKPLIWSINIPVVNSSWKRLFTELVGEAAKSIKIDNLAKPFYYRSYFNMGVVGDVFELLGLPRESVELIMGIQVAGSEKSRFRPSARTLRHLPRMMFFGLKKSMFSKEIEQFLPSQKKVYAALDVRDKDKLGIRETLKRIDKLIEADKETSYFVIITQLLMGLYNMALEKQLEKHGVEPERVDFREVMERIRDIDPRYHLSLLHRRYEALGEDERAQMQTTSFRDLSKLSGLKDLHDEIEGFLDDFGHLSDSGNDFSTVAWREAPEMVLEMIAGFKKPREEMGQRIDVSALSSNPLKGLLLIFLYGRAAKYREYRERISFLYTYGYGLFRPYFLHLARLFVENGFLKQRQDLFYLTLAEIQRVVKLGKMPSELEYAVEERKREVLEYKDLMLPDLIYGDSPPRPLASTTSASKLKGLGVSKGYYEGGTKVVRGLQDFHKIEEGDVLVIPFSDVSWTPLFAKAKAVISESGGMLSHSAIVAREYNIPAVVSVQGALELEDDTIVAVDGSSGEITVLDAAGDESKSTKALETH